MYFHACLQWHERLSADDQETCRTLADVMAIAHKGAAEGMAVSLPLAPQFPRDWSNQRARRFGNRLH
jgi:hypothetical protein